ncbi:hypothetical protein BDW42DRAFT_194624 [Aspergillus taichungensis]|uniref:Arrestin-like N-terminal domain-containing protein n=1 Tax=Aspergillus taichungensis TaxID=482145 RepID=A0A2J5HS98_9EURO|nr:hypothetical protein BDW42DRAFT_194624 [Aspergillus taichungensis]
MSPSSQAKGSSIEIELAAPPSWTYAPGDTIIGSVIRREPIATPEATVKVSFRGRVKTKLHVPSSGSHRTATYRDKRYLVGCVQDRVFHGPLHLPAGQETPLSWPFVLDIPPRPVTNVKDEHLPADRFDLLDKDILSQQILPPSFSLIYIGMNNEFKCLVEYHVEAEIRYIHGRSYKWFASTVPVRVRHPPTSTVLRNPMIQKIQRPREFESHRLVPDMEHHDLTFKEKTKRLFNLASDPHFCYNVHINVPTVVQLNSRSPIPLTFNISPELKRTSVEIRDIPRTLRLDWVKAVVKSTTRIKVQGYRPHYGMRSTDHDLRFDEIFKNLETPIVFPVEHGNQPINLGEMLCPVIESNAIRILGQRKTLITPIYPDFITFNMAHTHKISWELSLSVAGETQIMTIETRLKILPEYAEV